MKILVTGAQGQLGQTLMHFQSTHQLTGLTRAQLDITDSNQINAVIKTLAPDLIINAAAYTQVDQAEQEPALAFAINAKGAANLAQGCAKANIPLLHLSTDYVFSGEQTIPYQEADAAHPISVYGASKLAGEQAIRQVLDNYIILRVSGIFSVYGANFVKTILRLAGERKPMRIVADNAIAPTAANAIAAALYTLGDFMQADLKNTYAGTYHFCSRDAVSWHQFAQEIIKQAATYTNQPLTAALAITAAEHAAPARRPAYSVLDVSKLQQTFSIPQPSWQEGLAEMLYRLYQ